MLGVCCKMPIAIEQVDRIRSLDNEIKCVVEPEFIMSAMVGGEEANIVEIRRSRNGFARLVFHGCDSLPEPMPKSFSLT